MTTTIDEIAADIYRISTFVPGIGEQGLTFNQFLLADDQPLLFHTGHRAMFADVAAAIARVTPVNRLRWITFGHVESDECGSMNEFLAAAPDAQVAHGAVGCLVSLDHMADRPPRPLADGETIELGRMRVRHIDTPHTPHGWEARVLFEETTQTLLCGDLFTHLGHGPALTTGDIVDPAVHTEDLFAYSSLAPTTPVIVDRLAELAPRTLALMHGSSYTGDGGAALRALADSYRHRIGDATA
ncbi:MBL fold metallo-hydrolase [Nocardia sp. NPDC060249]|uniref:MBL fold metallo-hydrolase n=1 Tax=Nocardia sp. NPDC060249 TaxID=3347082 RepID=UPI003647137E